MSTISVTADIRQPITEVEATGYVTFQLVLPAVAGAIVYGTNQLVMAPVVTGQFGTPVVLQANVPWQITVQTDQWREQFTVTPPASPSPTTLGALFALSQTTPPFPTLYIPLSQRGVAGGVATLDPSTGLVPANELPTGSALAPWATAELYAGLANPGAIVDYSGNNINNPITLASGIYQNLRFVCSQLILPNNDTKLYNCDIVCGNANFSVRLDANTGLETGRYLEHCRITGIGVALAGAGFRARLCEVFHNGDDSARLGRSHAEPTVFEFCRFHDYMPAAGSHTDGIQLVTVPAADVYVYGCSIMMNTATGYTVPPATGYTAALFVDTADVAIPGGDPEPTRIGNIWVDSCKLGGAGPNYGVVIDGANVDLRNCMLLPGSTGIESIQAGITVTGHNNVDINGVPIVDTNILGSTQRFPTVGDPRLTLAALGDVDLTGAVDTNFLAYNFAESRWEPVPAPSGGGGSSTLAGLTDVNLAGLVDGKFLKWVAGASKWEPGTPAGGGGFTPIRVTSGPHLGDIFGGGSGGGQPTGIPPSVWILTLAAGQVAAGHLLQWSMPLISTGADAACDLASLVAGVPVNFYSDGYGPTQNVNGHSGLYVAGDFGAVQGPVVWWVVQPSDLAGDGSFTISFLFQPSGSHRWGHSAIPGQVDLVNFGPHN